MTTDTDDLESLSDKELNRVAAEVALDLGIIEETFEISIDPPKISVLEEEPYSDGDELHCKRWWDPANSASDALELLEGVCGKKWLHTPWWAEHPDHMGHRIYTFETMAELQSWLNNDDGRCDPLSYGYSIEWPKAATLAAIKAWEGNGSE